MPKAEPTVSVIIPCLNRAEYLSRTIDSVLNQTYPNIECIVVDGGSTDETPQILDSYGESITWVSDRDEGHSDAINKGWEMSSGEILAWLNADDVWDFPDGVSRAIDILEKNPDIDVIYGDCGAIDENDREVGTSHVHEWDLEYALEFCDHCIPQPASFIRRRAVSRVGWLDTRLTSGKDHDLWIQIALSGGSLKHFPVILAHERTSSGTWDAQGDVTARGKLMLTRKALQAPQLPPHIREKHRRIRSNARLKAAEYCWNNGRHWVKAIGHLFLSMVSDFSNWRPPIRYLGRIVKTALVRLRDRGQRFGNVHTR